jgi:hypothetical protein
MSYRILSRKQLAHKETLFVVEAPDIAAEAQPGQFLIVIPRQGGERVPLTICDYDAQKGTISFAFHEVGKTTKELGTFDPGGQPVQRHRTPGQSIRDPEFRPGAVRRRQHNDRPVAAPILRIESGWKSCDHGPGMQKQGVPFHEGRGRRL